MLNLKACPFCGCEADLSKDSFGRFTVICSGDACGAVMVGFKNRQQVVDAWNNRIEHVGIVRPPVTPAESNAGYHDVCTIREMAQRLKSDKINLSETAIRRFIISGQLPSVKVGVKNLISYQNVIELLIRGDEKKSQEIITGKIRRVKD